MDAERAPREWREVHFGVALRLIGLGRRIQLIERFYDPLAGHVYLDGQDIAELNVQEYRKQISLVSQEPVSLSVPWSSNNSLRGIFQTLYAGTVRFNILLGATKPEAEVTQEEIEDACRNANILEFIQSLPEYAADESNAPHTQDADCGSDLQWL